MDMIFVETCQACEEIIKDIPFDYFNVLFEPKIIDENGEVQGEKESCRFPRPSLGRAAESGSVDRFCAGQPEDQQCVRHI